MMLELQARGMAALQSTALEAETQRCAAAILGRLHRRVRRAVVRVSERDASLGGFTHVCTMRLEVPGAADIVVQQQSKGAEAALAGAFRKARRELQRRGRLLGRALVSLSGMSPALPEPA